MSDELGRVPVLTVAICTFERARSLARTLDSLVAQTVASTLAWELLVVDNNSRDETASVIAAYEGQLPLRREAELNQGLSHARNRALATFRSETILFTDDDVVLAPDWLERYANAISSQDADFFAGRIIPLWQRTKPAWLRDEAMPLIAGVLAHYDLGSNDRWLGEHDLLPFGASFGIRRSLAERLGTFRTDLGVVGLTPGRGEETAYFAKAVATGARGYYVGSALAAHAVNNQRLRPSALFRHGVQSGIAV